MEHGATKYSEKLIEETKKIWQVDTDDPITTQFAIEILDNTIALFDLILELEEKYGKT